MISNKDIRGVCQAVGDVFKGTGFVVMPLGRFAGEAGGQYDRVRIRHHDPDMTHWREVCTLELTEADTVGLLISRCRSAIEQTRERWEWERFKAEQRLLRSGRTQGEV